MSFEVRASKPEEREEVLDVTDAAFEDAPQGFFDAAWRHDPNDAPELHRVGVLDGRIVSAARISRKTVCVGCAELTLGGIADVATHPEFRGHGYSTAVLHDCIRYMDESGYHLSMLFTGIHGFYRRLGWEIFPTYSHTFQLRRSDTAVALTDDAVTRIEVFDRDQHLEVVTRVYEVYNIHRTGTVRRDAHYYANTLRWRYDPRAFFVGRDDRRVVAYVRGAFGGQSTLHEFGCLPGHEGALRVLLQRFAAEAQANGAECITAMLPRDPCALTALSDVVESVSVHQHSEMMLRLMDGCRFLQTLAPELARRAVAAGYTAAFVLGLRCGEEEVAIRWDGSHIDIGNVDDAPFILHLSPLNLLQLLLGAGAPVLRLVPMTENQRRLVEAVANPGEFVFWSVDHF